MPWWGLLVPVDSWQSVSILGSVTIHLQDCELLRPARPWSLERHRHDAHELLLVKAGHYALRLDDGTRYEAEAGQAVVVPAGTWHLPAYRPDGRLCFWSLRWQGDGPSRPICLTDRNHRLSLACDWLWGLAQRRNGADEPALQGLLTALLHEAQLLVTEPAESGPTDRLLTYLRNNCDQRLRLSELAAISGESVWSLLRRCRRELGISPMQLQKRCRVEWAARLTADGWTRQAAAQRVGYAGAAALAKAKRSLGRRANTADRRPAG
jgi:AraC-like DNA-binding protein/mannose-6-phosphate isomerase-like protein (cupin superfamily)